MPRPSESEPDPGLPKPKACGERKKGFHVGPAHAPRDAYLGKGQSAVPSYTNPIKPDDMLWIDS